jgi:hypothetical protein
MDLKKEYINQVLTTASHNLRLTSEKIELIAILKEFISKSSNVCESIAGMKKVTELSKFAIKLGEVNNYISGDKIDFLKLSEKFKEHSHNIIIEFSSLLEKLNPEFLRSLLARTSYSEKNNIIEDENEHTHEDPELIENEDDSFEDEEQDEEAKGYQKSASDILKESIIMEDMPEKLDKFDFQDFEDSILKPIKDIDSFLSKLTDMKYTDTELDKFILLTTKNAEASKKIGFEILSNMNATIAATLKLIKSESIFPDNNIVENLRACLIVIVAVVRGKNVDITGYLNRAEKFGKEIFEKV